MGKKSKKKDKKKVDTRKQFTSGVEERVKHIASIKEPEEMLFKKENEDLVERWRPLWRSDRTSIAEKSRLEKRGNRPKRPQRRVSF